MVKVLMKSKMAVYMFLSHHAQLNLNLTPVSGPTPAKKYKTLKDFFIVILEFVTSGKVIKNVDDPSCIFFFFG